MPALLSFCLIELASVGRDWCAKSCTCHSSRNVLLSDTDMTVNRFFKALESMACTSSQQLVPYCSICQSVEISILRGRDKTTRAATCHTPVTHAAHFTTQQSQRVFVQVLTGTILLKYSCTMSLIIKRITKSPARSNYIYLQFQCSFQTSSLHRLIYNSVNQLTRL